METKQNRITIKHSIIICRPKELVWDYTQNYENRCHWDNTILEATVLQSTPNRIVKLKAKGNTVMTFHYKLDDRPHKTSLIAKKSFRLSSNQQAAHGATTKLAKAQSGNKQIRLF